MQFVTWFDVKVENKKAIIYGQNSKLVLKIEKPINTGQFLVEELEKESKANMKPNILKRLKFIIPEKNCKDILVQIKMQISEREKD